MSGPPGEARAAWIGLISKLLDELKDIYDIKEPISTEAGFRDAFFQLCEDHNVAEAERQYGYFRRFHETITSFIKVVDEAVFLDPPDTLNNVFWQHAYAALDTALSGEFQFADFRDIYPELNKDLPLVGCDLSQHAATIKVQWPLQKIFEAYITCYVKFVSQLKTAEDDIDREPIAHQVEEASTLFTEQDEEWRQRCEEAQEELNTRALQSYPGGEDNVDERFQHVRELGNGSYGTVDEIKEISFGTLYARKSIPVFVRGQDATAIALRVKNEVDIMSKLRHKHIASVNMVFKSDTYFSMIMLPVADYDLKYFLDVKCVAAGYPREAMKMMDPWFGCLITALAYAHEEMVKHEDIKPSNILIKGKTICLTDFGTAKDFSDTEQSRVGDFFETGTPVYWAPEPRAWGRPADVFALGCVFSEMLTVRQHRSLQEYRKFRINTGQEMRYAFRNNLRAVRRWLKHLEGATRSDSLAQTIHEQILNMLLEDSQQRLTAKRIKKNFHTEEDLFCTTCF